MGKPLDRGSDKKTVADDGGRRTGADYLRGIALLWIMLGHYISIVRIDKIWPDGILVKVLWNGVHYPVYIFFIISGYFLTRKSYFTENDEMSLKRRLKAIMPNYLFFLIFFIAFSLAIPHGRYLIYDDFWAVTGSEVKIRASITKDLGQSPGSRYYIADVGQLGSQFLDVITDPKHDRSHIIISNRDSLKILMYGKVSPTVNVDELDVGFDGEIPIRLPLDFQYKDKLSDFAPYLGFYQNYNNKVFLMHHTWFLAFMIHFYILFWVVSSLIRRLSSTDRNRRRIFGLLVALGIITSVTLRILHPNPLEWRTHMLIDIPLYGSLIAMFEMRYRERLGEVLFRMFALGGGLGLVFGAIFYLRQPQTFAALGMALVVLSVVTGKVKLPEKLRPICVPIIWIGRKSYTLYLWHWPLGFAFAVFYCNYLDLNVYVSMALMGISVVLLASWMDKAFSLLFRRFGLFRTVAN